MRARLILPAVAIAVATFAGVGALATPYDTLVAARDNEFAPRNAQGYAGTPVIWTNSGSLPHEVTAVDGSFTSGNIAPGASYSFTPTKVGRFAYYCRYHGTATSGMVGTLSIESHGALPKTGGGREVAVGIAIVLVTAVIGAGLSLGSRAEVAR